MRGSQLSHLPKASFPRRPILVMIAFLVPLSFGAMKAGGRDANPREPLAPLQAPGPLDPSRVALGEALFSDPILSGKNQLSCASCHDLGAGGTINRARTIGYMGRVHRFNAPTVFNVGNNYRLGWRGDFTSLEAQNEKVLLDENLMAATWPTLLQRLRDNNRYAMQFERAYGGVPTRAALLDALATFQRSLSTPNSAFDRYLEGNKAAMNTQELEGYRIFKDYGCASCHQGSNIGGNMFQKFGIFSSGSAGDRGSDNDGDLGRFTLTGQKQDIGVFRVPSLRNVAVTAPYFHDGRIGTLRDAVSLMARSQLGRTLTAEEVDALVAFLKTLTGEYHGRTLKAAATIRH
ncbi:c-type cytochrome (plasmid) [Rhizobium sp. WYJ-E13]|nr:c-type cytochrome [Rhizobium sp. WYJ-E13]